MYFRQHMTDVVRAFGYEEVSREEARRRVEPLIERYGRPDIEAACAEIVEATPAGLWRLTEHARQLAAGMLGRPKSPVPAAPPTESPATSDDSKAAGEEQKKPSARTSRKRRNAKEQS